MSENTISLRYPLFAKLGFARQSRRARVLSTRTIQKTLKLVLLGQTALLLCFLAFYVFQIGSLLQLSYAVKIAEQQISEFINQALALSGNRDNRFFLSSIEKEIAELGFVEAGEIKYLPLIPGYLVKNQ